MNKRSTTLIGKHTETVLRESMNKRTARASKQAAVLAALMYMGDDVTASV